MGRWEPDSRGRLQEAALALYSERGFDQTTAAQIAARAGVTERTFFRHFADKREVLFGGSALLQERIVAGVAGAPAADGPLDAVAWGLDAAAAMLGRVPPGPVPPAPGGHRRQPRAARARTGQAGRLRRRGRRRPPPAGRGRAPGHPGRRGRHDRAAGAPGAVGRRGRRPRPRRHHAGGHGRPPGAGRRRLTGEPLLERHHQLGAPNAIRYSLFAIRYALQRSPSHGCSPSSAKSATATVSCSGFVAWLGGHADQIAGVPAARAAKFHVD